ncbi:MAG: 50S ribosomal protein L11 methyltransferase [Pseudomonadota bacterium]
MVTFTAMTTVAGRAAADSLGQAVEGLSPAPIGLGVFEIEDDSGLWEVGAYFDKAPDRASLILLAAVHGARDFVVSKVEERDWVAQVRRELSPVPAGRFVVHGAHDLDAVSSNQIGLRIEAAMAFGTGHHETTLGCLLALDLLARKGVVASRVADIGCGTGVLAIAAAKLWRCMACASDIDPVAVATATENVRINCVGPRVRVLRAIGTRSPDLRRGGPYDLIFANILAGPLKRLAPEMAEIAAPGGRVILSGILSRQRRGVEAIYRSHGFAPVHRLLMGEWSTLVLRRARPDCVRIS